MKEFPKLKNDEVAVARGNFQTGDVLDEHFNIVTSESQIVYSVFQNETAAVEYVQSVMQDRKEAEFYIFGADMGLLQYLGAKV